MDNPDFDTEGPEVVHRKQRNEESYANKALQLEGEKIPQAETKAVLPQTDDKTKEGSKGPADDAVNLERKVGLFSGIALIIGTQIGSGIFVSPKGVLERSGSAGLSLIVWAGCGVLSLLGALCYAELGTLCTESGGEYAYYMEAFNPKATRQKRSWYKPIPAYLLAWLSIMILKPSSLAIITMTSAKYIVRAARVGCDHAYDTNWQEEKDQGVKLLACCIMLLISFFNCVSVKLATKVQNVFTATKLLALVFIIIGGIYKLAMGNVQYLQNGFVGSSNNFGDIATAFYSGLWAYDGWNNLNYVTEELKNPYVNLPRAIIIGIPLVTVCYVLVNVSYLAVMSTEELLASETVAVLFGGRVIGNFGEILMILSVAASTFGSANGSAFTSARICFVAAREGHMVDLLSYVHARKLTPTPALLFNVAIALLMVIPSDIDSLIDYFSFTAWISYGFSMVTLLVLRYTQKDTPRPYKVPIIIPLIVLVISVYLVLAPIIDDPKIQYFYATLFILLGLIFYFPFVHWKKSIPGMKNMTTFFQLLLEVVPTDYIPES